MKKIILIILTLSFFKSMTLANEVNVFSARHYDSDIQLYNKFTSQTGIKVNVISGKDKSLQKRIIEEGKDSKADLYITADAGKLGLFDLKGMFQNSMSPAIKSAVPANFRSKNWTGIAKRARIIYYSPERVSDNDLNGLTYEGLADPKWKGRIVIRQSNNIYNLIGHKSSKEKFYEQKKIMLLILLQHKHVIYSTFGGTTLACKII